MKALMYALPATTLSAVALPSLLDTALKCNVILAAAAVAAWMPWRGSATARHSIWLACIAALLLLPVLSIALPQWRVLPTWMSTRALAARIHTDGSAPDLTRPTAARESSYENVIPSKNAVAEVFAASESNHRVMQSTRSAVVQTAKPHQLGTVLVLTWMTVASMLLLRIGMSRWMLGKLLGAARPVRHGTIHDVVMQARGELDIRREVTVFLCSRRTMPMTWGIFSVNVLLPRDADRWDMDMLRSVLLHELAHTKRFDTGTHVLSQICCAAYWFHPLVWLAACQMRHDRERACDDMVLAGGVKPSEYARHLLDVATRCDRRRLVAGVTLAMAATTDLEARLQSILHRTLDRRGLARWQRALMWTTTAIIVFPVAMLRAGDLTMMHLPAIASSQVAVARAQRSGTPPVTADRLKDRDSDGDDLSDFQEVHKYGTDPGTKDSDGDGTPDGDWNERREYAYTVRSIVRVIPPCGTGEINDDYQDARILEETGDYVELEVIHYPFANGSRAVVENRNWRRDYAGMTEYLKPRINANWDGQMQQDLLNELKTDGIDVDQLTDKQVVERVSNWFLQTYKGMPMFNALHVHYPQGRAQVMPGRESMIDKTQAEWSLQDQFEHELLGRTMFYYKTRGTCTSSATGLTTVLRAVGIPTRMVLCIPIVDASDEDQVAKARNRLTHHQVRQTVLDGVSKLGASFASHTFNEVMVGNRWRRLNYNRLGQPILDRDLFGLMTHVHTFNDLSEWGLQPTWGKWSASNRRTYVFGHSNPYATVALSDRFGPHANVSNPPVKDDRLDRLTVSKAYWFHSPDRPATISAASVPKDGAGHMLLHVDEEFRSLKEFDRMYAQLDKSFILKSDGRPDVHARAERGYWGTEFYVRVTQSEFSKMVKDVPYQLVATNGSQQAPKWVILPTVSIVKGDSAPDADPAGSEFQRLTVTKAFWSDSPDAPQFIRAALPGTGNLLMHVKENVSGDMIKAFTGQADRAFLLEADGRPSVRIEASVGSVTASGLRGIHIQMTQAQYSTLAPGVPYRIRPLHGAPGYQWIIDDSVTVQRPVK